MLDPNDILLAQGHWSHTGVAIITHCVFAFWSIQALFSSLQSIPVIIGQPLDHHCMVGQESELSGTPSPSVSNLST